MHSNIHSLRLHKETPSRPEPTNIFGIKVRGATETTPGLGRLSSWSFFYQNMVGILWVLLVVMTNIANWKITMFHGEIHYKWSFSIAMILQTTISGWWYTNPSEKQESQFGWGHSQYMENKQCSKPPTRRINMFFLMIQMKL